MLHVGPGASSKPCVCCANIESDMAKAELYENCRSSKMCHGQELLPQQEPSQLVVNICLRAEILAEYSSSQYCLLKLPCGSPKAFEILVVPCQRAIWGKMMIILNSWAVCRPPPNCFSGSSFLCTRLFNCHTSKQTRKGKHEPF